MPKPHLDYESPSRATDAEWLGPAACLLGLSATLVPTLGLFPMLTIANGAVIRPMDQVLWMFLGAAVGVVIVLPLSLVSIGVSWRRNRSARWGVRALVLAISSVVVTPAVFLVLFQG